MSIIYKVFLGIFSLILVAALYFLDWTRLMDNPENEKLFFSIAAAIIGILIVFILNTLSRIK